MPQQEHEFDGIGSKPSALGRCLALVPGIALCGAITAVSLGAQLLEERIFAHPYVEALVIAILLGLMQETPPIGLLWTRWASIWAAVVLTVLSGLEYVWVVVRSNATNS